MRLSRTRSVVGLNEASDGPAAAAARGLLRLLDRLSTTGEFAVYLAQMNLLKLPKLLRVTLFDNPLATHPNYRHFLVNSIFSLRALDLHVISDEELIEGAHFPSRFGSRLRRTCLAMRR